MTKNVALITGALALSLCGAGQAMAGQLLNLLDPSVQSNTPYVLSFTAGATTTDIQFEGYQVPSTEGATDISLTSGGGSNLLGEYWTLTPAASGSDAGQYIDGYGTGTNAVYFSGLSAGYYDQFDQLVSTVVGQTYDLSFLFTEQGSGPSSFIVSATGTPEPASMFLFGSGLLGVTIAARRRRKTA
jgi:hypothetical protein